MTIRFSRVVWQLLIAAPLVLFLGLVVTFSEQIVREVPIAWVDLDHTSQSRAIQRELEAAPALKLEAHSSVDQAHQALISGEVFGMVVIPQDFAADLMRHNPPTIRAVVNGQLVLVAKVIRAGLSSVLVRDQAAARAADTLVFSADVQGAIFSAAPVQVQLTPLFNRAGNYGQFLLPAILLAIWQILIVVTTVVHLTERSRNNVTSEEGWITEADSFSSIWQRSLSLFVWFFLQGTFAALILYGMLGYPFFASMAWLIPIAVLFIMACQGIAICVCLIDGEATKAVSFAGALTAPSFAFLGVTFPTSDMPNLATYWRELLPAAHGSELFFSLANYGVWSDRLVYSVLALLLMVLATAPIYWLKRGRTQ